ncbi:MAG: Na+/H+ antiporter subunit D [Desulfobacterales bacterium]|nr:Na+/H+ antiporter subunit D [Desulfobacterales bacterium]
MNNLLVYPVLIPFAAAAVCLLFRQRPAIQQAISLVGSASHLIACGLLLQEVINKGIQVLFVGNWPAPFGISLVADHLSVLMLSVTGILGTAAAVYARGEMSVSLRNQGFHPLFHILIGGLSGAFLTGDLFNLYVWFEVMLIASFGLLMWGQRRAQFSGAVRYVVINLLATLLFLLGLALLYGLTGTLNMAHLHQIIATHDAKGLLTAISFVFMAAFGIKAGMFPFFFWLPASYHTPPVAISALFAGMLTKVGVYALIRTFSLVFSHDIPATHSLLLLTACLTMVTGVLGAAAQNEFRRVLSFHIISQVGYMILGLALWTPLALTGTVFYLVHHMIVKANLFLVSGLGRDINGTMDLERMGDIYSKKPFVAALFFIPAFSLAGFPPLSGFWAKLLLVQSSLQVQHYIVAAIAVIVGFLTVFSMVKIWLKAFWEPIKNPAPHNSNTSISLWKLVPVAVLGLITLFIGIGAEPFYQLAVVAAEELMAPGVYVKTVLSGGTQ